MKMTNKAKRWSIIAAALMLCVILLTLIGAQFTKETIVDEPLPQAATEPSEVVVGPIAEKENPVSIRTPSSSQVASEVNGAVDTGTEQTIQADVSQPEYSEEALGDPTQTPDGQPVEGDPPVPVAPETPTGGETNGNGQIYVPGFGWIDDIGEGQGTTNEDMYENGNKIGIMD